TRSEVGTHRSSRRAQNAATSGGVCSLMPEIETISCPATSALSQRQVSQRFTTLLQQLTFALSRQDLLDGLDDLLGVRFGARAEPLDHLATGRDQEFFEIPLHV